LPALEGPVALVERPELGLGSHIWDASLSLALHLLRCPLPPADFGSAFDVVELGAGIGLSSLACLAAYAHARHAYLTDIPDVLSDAADATRASLPSSLRARTSLQPLLWTDPAPPLPSFLTGSTSTPLLVLAADVTYNTSSHAALAATLTAVLRCRPRTMALLAYRPRAPADEGFFALARDQGITTETLEGEGFGDVQIWRLMSR
jgi:predicted nicotinamide N-methyase